MAYKQLPGFADQLPEITFEGVSCVLRLGPEFWQVQPLYGHYILKLAVSMMLFPHSETLDSDILKETHSQRM
jgi:hypothetical protein